jgi:hypothetical protein
MFLKNDHQNHWGFRMKMWSKIVFQQPVRDSILWLITHYKRRGTCELELQLVSGKKSGLIPVPLVGRIAQLVEQRTENPCVAGSIPAPATTFFLANKINSFVKTGH